MNEVKEIVVIGLHLGLGGAERVFSELMSEWASKGIPVTMIQARPNTGGKNYPLDKAVDVVDMHFPKGRFRRIRQTKELVGLLRKRRNATVISFMNETTLLTGLASFFIKNKIVFTERNDPYNVPGSKPLRAGRNLMFEIADTCVFQTQEAKEYFSKRVQKKGYIIQNPINPDLPTPYTGQRKKVVIAAGRLEHQKNFTMLIDAFGMFHKNHPEYTLEIYGSGALERELNDHIKEMKLENCAKLMGFSNDIYSQMRECAMYVSSSDHEGISNSMLEALGMGLPSICTDCPVGGARETIRDGENGLLIPVGDVQALYRSMCRIADDPLFADKLSENARKIREELSVERIAEQWLKVMG